MDTELINKVNTYLNAHPKTKAKRIAKDLNIKSKSDLNKFLYANKDSLYFQDTFYQWSLISQSNPVELSQITSLSYNDGQALIQSLCVQSCGREQNTTALSPEFTIEYPGKKGRFDYIFRMSGNAISHADICEILVDYIDKDILDYHTSKKLLENLYKDGLNIIDSDFPEIKRLKLMLYWVTLQEDINYPPPSQGKRMAFKRYAEAIAAACNKTRLTLAQVKYRTNNRYHIPPDIEIEDPPDFY